MSEARDEFKPEHFQHVLERLREEAPMDHSYAAWATAEMTIANLQDIKDLATICEQQFELLDLAKAMIDAISLKIKDLEQKLADKEGGLW